MLQGERKAADASLAFLLLAGQPNSRVRDFNEDTVPAHPIVFPFSCIISFLSFLLVFQYEYFQDFEKKSIFIF
jgi:hypothetical protein